MLPVLQKILTVGILILPLFSQNVYSETLLIKDSEIEYLVRASVRPMLLNSQIEPESLSILVIEDSRLNAFTQYGTIGVFTGIIEKGTPEMLLGILAHEVGHLAYGDLLFQEEYVASSLKKYIAIMLALSGLSIATSKGEIGMVGNLLTQHVMEREYLNFRREEEAGADVYALDILQRSGFSSKGLMEFFHLYMKKNAEVSELNPYLMTHELPHTRLEKLEEKAKASPYYNSPVPENIEIAFAMSRGKIVGSFYEMDKALSFYKTPQNRPYFDAEANYSRAILHSRLGNNAMAIEEINSLIQQYPNYPFFHSTKASMLQEIGDNSEAMREMEVAIDLADPDYKGYLELQLAKLLLQTENLDSIEEAISLLVKFFYKESENIEALTLLTIGYGKTGEEGKSHLANARKFIVLEEKSLALEQLEMALEMLPQDSPSWIQASELLDILTK